MTVDVELTITGLQEAQQANLRVFNALRPRGAMGRAVQLMGGATHNKAVFNTPWDYGALRASHRTKFQEGRSWARGRMFIAADSVNPRGQRPSVYGPIEHDRGGSHAFYERTQGERGSHILRAMADIVVRGL